MKNNYIKSLDGVRFLAVTLVLADHWSGDKIGFPAAYLGVCMFFVLSGFLITRILLSAKEKDSALNRGHRFSLKQFYIRRTIRIFPVYYLTLFILILFNVPPVREKAFWLFTYMTNNYIGIKAHWLGSVDHLWSLAVEEQFYIFFPFVVLFLPLKHLAKTLGLFILISVSIRAYFYFSGASWITPYVLMPTCLDAFGLGGILAYAAYYQKQNILSFLRKPASILLGLFIYCATVFLIKEVSEGHNLVSIIFLRLAESILSVLLIGYLISQVKSNSLTRFFELEPFVFIGKISYGIYIYHNFVYNAYHSPAGNPFLKVVNRLQSSGNTVLASLPVKVLFLYLAVILIASISWFVFEKPINKLKNRYGY